MAGACMPRHLFFLNLAVDRLRASADCIFKIVSSRTGRSIPWRDTHVRIEGPVVAQFQKLFFENWNEHGCEVDTAEP